MLADVSKTPNPKSLGKFSVGFSLKSDGPMERVQSRRQEAQKNRRRFFERISFGGDDLDWVRPTQSPNIELVQKLPGKNRLMRTEYLSRPNIDTDYDFYYTGTDGILTTDRTFAVALISGDCVPLMIWDEDSGLHGIIHAGILGALNGIVKRLRPLFHDLNIDAQKVHVYLGPSISKKNYDVTRSGLWTAIEAQVLCNRKLLSQIEPYFDGKYFDLRGIIGYQLTTVGVSIAHIQYFDHCTASDESLFFSHYVAKQCGEEPHNFCSVIWPTN